MFASTLFSSRKPVALASAAAVCLAVFPPAAPAGAEPAFETAGGVLTVRTDRYEASFRYGALVALANRLTGETVAAADGDIAELLPRLAHGVGVLPETEDPAILRDFGRFHNWLGDYPLDQVHAWMRQPGPRSVLAISRPDDRTAVLRYTGLHGHRPEAFFPRDVYELRVKVLPDGTLGLQAYGEAAEGRVFGVSTALANLSADMRYVLPVLEGSWFDPREVGPFQLSAHWPQPWQASLVIAESARGSIGLWVAGPRMRDRYLHLRHDADRGRLAVMFESMNPAPFDDDRSAASRPMRVNVYDGGWALPAKQFRAWWAEAFNVRPLAERRDDQLPDLRVILAHHTEDIPEVTAGKSATFGAQDWKVGPKVGDHGLFPFDMSPGPQLRVFGGDFLPKIRAAGSRAFVYQNISHMSRAHPLAPSFWPYRMGNLHSVSVVPPTLIADRTEEDPRFGAPNSFVVHCAHKPWQDLVVDWVTTAHERFGIKGWYMDCARGVPNSRIGLVDGKNNAEGECELINRLRAAVPGGFFGVEYLTEVTATVADLGAIGYDAWFSEATTFPRDRDWSETHIHPILGLLFNDYAYITAFGGHKKTFHETLGRLPSAFFPRVTERTITDYSVVEGFEPFRARLLCRTLMRPVYPDTWERGVRSYWEDREGNAYRILADTPTGSRMVRVAPDGREEAVYWRIKGRRRAQMPAARGITGWIAYDGQGAIGLDPDREYLYTAEPRIDDWRIASLPAGLIVESVRPYRPGLLVAELKAAGDGAEAGTVELHSARPLHTVIVDGRARPLEAAGTVDGLYRYRVDTAGAGWMAWVGLPFEKAEAAAAGGVSFDFAAHQPAGFTNLGSTGVRLRVRDGRATHVVPARPASGDRPAMAGRLRIRPPSYRWPAVADYLVRLPEVPDGRKLVLTFRSTVPDFKNNGYSLHLRVNGKELLTADRPGATPPASHRVDLTAFAGQDVAVTFRILNRMTFTWTDMVDPVLRVE